MRIAIVHDWLTGMRGGERVLEVFLKLYPQADLYSLLHIPGAVSPAVDARVKGTSFLQKIPGAKRFYRALLPLYPWAAWSLDLSGYDLIISLSHAAAKNIRVPTGARHICYCFTPMRYVWDQTAAYLGAKRFLAWPVIQALRDWDRGGSDGVYRFAAISRFVAARVRCFYDREAAVIYPPVATDWIRPAERAATGEAFLCAGALVPYKRIDLVVEAFNRTGDKLWIVGSGSEEARLRHMAGPNIEFLGRLSDAELADRYRRARALIFPGAEDFGLVPIEMLAAGRPVIGLYDGALRETLDGLKPWDNSQRLAPKDACGVFFRKGTDPVNELARAVSLFKEIEDAFSPEVCVQAAKAFGVARFCGEWLTFVGSLETAKTQGGEPTTVSLAAGA